MGWLSPYCLRTPAFFRSVSALWFFLKIHPRTSGQNSLNALPLNRPRNPKMVRDNAWPTVASSPVRHVFEMKLLAGIAIKRGIGGPKFCRDSSPQAAPKQPPKCCLPPIPTR